mmetsp:Transcript_15932/g.60715  ORF Transcript_15932/g.60715 Transcript_15932/m.60715 type:complete len:263 (+) Transcript_15932:83-871(+)
MADLSELKSMPRLPLKKLDLLVFSSKASPRSGSSHLHVLYLGPATDPPHRRHVSAATTSGFTSPSWNPSDREPSVPLKAASPALVDESDRWTAVLAEGSPSDVGVLGRESREGEAGSGSRSPPSSSCWRSLSSSCCCRCRSCCASASRRFLASSSALALSCFTSLISILFCSVSCPTSSLSARRSPTAIIRLDAWLLASNCCLLISSRSFSSSFSSSAFLSLAAACSSLARAVSALAASTSACALASSSLCSVLALSMRRST